MRPVYCAMTVPRATPANPSGVCRPSQMLAERLTMLTVMSTIIGKTVFCMPMNQPLKTISDRVAGASHILMKKYLRASSCTSPEQSMNINAASTNSHWMAIRKVAESRAVDSPWTKYLMAPAMSLRP